MPLLSTGTSEPLDPHPPQQYALWWPFYPREPVFLLRMDGADEDCPQSGKASGHDIGEELIAHHGGSPPVEAHPLDGSQTSDRQRLASLGDEGQPDPVGKGSNSLAQAVGDQAEADIGIRKIAEPTGHVWADRAVGVAFQRAVDVQQERIYIELTKTVGIEFQDGFDVEMRGDESEHGVD